MKVLSLITVCYNAEQTIERTIESIVGQKNQQLEYIIIDGGSKDNTMNIVQKYASQIDVIVSEKDQGISDAFNKGIERATGQFVGLINADDWLEPNAVNELIAQIKENKDIDVFYANMHSWRDGKIEFTAKANHEKLDKEMTVNHPAVFVAKRVYNSIGGFNMDYKCAMDYELLLRIYTEKYKFYYIDKVLVNMSMDGFSDRLWMVGCKEVRKAKLEQGFSEAKASLWFVRQVGAIALVKLALFLRLNGILEFYRKHFAKVAKIGPSA